MELVACKNCLHVYGDVQDECPVCGADDMGNGAEVELDGTTRMAVQSLGGVYGGILPGTQTGAHVLWCESGVVLYEEERGFVWKAKVHGRVDEVSPRADSVIVTVGRREVRLHPEHGTELDH